MNSLQNRALKGWRTPVVIAAGVSILGMAAYVLFTQTDALPEEVRARQANDSTIPVESLPAPASLIGQPTTAETTPEPSPAPQPAADVSDLNAIALLTQALAAATPEQKATANKLLEFATTGQTIGISNVTRDQVKSLARYLTDQVGVEEIASLLESRLHLPPDMFLRQENPSSALADLFDAVKGSEGTPPERAVIFTDKCETDGSVTGNVHVIPSGTRRVYAAFENAGGLHGLDRVLAVWRDPKDQKMVFTEYEPVNAGATYNYVWLELNEGWPAGYYQLDLYHPRQTTQLLASRGFNVR